VAKGILAKLGYHCDVAGDGVEALAALERRSYDAVLMDWHMPEMDGLQATVEIRRQEAGQRHVPIIAMTAGALIDDREKCLVAGMDDYVSKPVKEKDLESVLDRWLAGAASPTRPQSGSPDLADEVLDAAQFDGLRGLAAASGDPGFLTNLVGNYLESAECQLAELRQAATCGDVPALLAAAHGLRGTSATIGAAGVATACQALESSAARGEEVGAEELDRVAGELRRATTALHLGARPG